MIKLRCYNTPNSWWYIGCDWMRNHWFSFHFLTKTFVLYYGKNTIYTIEKRNTKRKSQKKRKNNKLRINGINYDG